MHKLNNWKNDVNRNLNSNEQGFLGKKLEAAEWPVDPGVWQAVSAQVSASATAGGAAASAGIFTKIALWVGAAAIGVATVVVVVRETKPDPKAKSPAPVEQARVEVPTTTIISDSTKTEDTPNTAMETASRTIENSTPASTEPTKVTAQASSLAPKTPTSESNALPLSEQAQVETSSIQAPPATAVAAEGNQVSPAGETAVNRVFAVDFEVVFNEHDELEVQFNAILPQEANCEWDFGDGNRAFGASLSHRFEAEGSYIVKVLAEDNDGHLAEFEAKVDVFRTPKLILPNIFTPNNDGRNDFLTVAPDSQNITVERMVVIDGSGSLVYEAIGANARWDGTLQSGEPAPAGSYRLIVSAVSYSGERMHESTVVRLER